MINHIEKYWTVINPINGDYPIPSCLTTITAA